MTTETINGLHKCQPKNTPKQGEVKNMVVEHKPARGDKKAWIKITNKKPEEGGSPYRILNVEPLDWPPDQYGNVAMNLEVEASNGSAFSQARATMQQGDPEHRQRHYPPDERYDTPEKAVNAPQSPVHAQQGEDRPMSKDDYWRRKEERDERKEGREDQRQKFIIRQHSQSMALEVLKLKVTLNELTVEDLTPAKLKQLADYFDRDVLGATNEN